MDEPEWLQLARELQAIAQAGLAFSDNAFDRQRFHRVREIAASLHALGSGAAREQVLALFEGEQGYPTPKVDVRAAVFTADERVLLVREVSDGRWTLPGGWADVNQSARECVEREALEESGFEVRALKIAAVLDYRRQAEGRPRPYTIYKLFFVCELIGGEPRPSIETSAVEFFPVTALPELSVGRTTAAQIERMLEHRRDPTLSTDFD